MSYTSVLLIEELDSRLEALLTFELRGTGLPFRGAGWKTESNLTTTWYPRQPGRRLAAGARLQGGAEHVAG